MNKKCIISVVVIFSVFSYTCAQSDILFETVGNKTIHYNAVKMNWYSAFQYCILRGLQLLTINTPLENFLISDYIKGISTGKIQIWTSGTDGGNEGRWTWMSTGKSFSETFSYWFGMEPNKLIRSCMDEDCLMVGFKTTQKCFYWNDDPCSFTYTSICEKP